MLKEPSFRWPPIGAPLDLQSRDEHNRQFDDSVNAVSFGFVATAILVAMFLVMAIFERFLRPNSPALPPSDRRNHEDLEAQLGFNAKLGHPSPQLQHNAANDRPLLKKTHKYQPRNKQALMTVYASGVSVLMPGDNIPTFIAHPKPVVCPPERSI